MVSHPLDNPVWTALTGPHSHLALTQGEAARYPADVAPFAAFAEGPTARSWDDLRAIVEPGGVVALPTVDATPPAGWDVVVAIPAVQLLAPPGFAAEDPEAQPLGAADVPEMLDLIKRTDPGPFARRTIELGRYLGFRRAGALAAMAGERMHLPDHVEISAVCTDEAHRGRGLATRLCRAVAAGIGARGQAPFLHAATSNERAVRLYLALGFTLRRELTILVVRAAQR